MNTCSECGEIKPPSEFSKNGAYYRTSCKACRRVSGKKYRDNNQIKIKKAQKKYYESNKSLFYNYNAERRAKQLNATPTWLTCEHKAHIKRTYKLAQTMQEITGKKYHVDHIVPLNNQNICGLHVPWNLQVLQADLNLSKSNSFEV